MLTRSILTRGNCKQQQQQRSNLSHWSSPLPVSRSSRFVAPTFVFYLFFITTMEGLDDLIKKTNLKLDRHAKNQLIGKLFGKVIERNEYRDKWMADNAWVQAIYETTNISTTFEITACELNSVISRNSPFRHNSIEHLLSPNRLGLYKRTVHLKNSLSKTVKVTAYYSTKPGCLPPKPKRNNKWHQEVLETPPKAILTRSRDTTTNLHRTTCVTHTYIYRYIRSLFTALSLSLSLFVTQSYNVCVCVGCVSPRQNLVVVVGFRKVHNAPS